MASKKKKVVESTVKKMFENGADAASHASRVDTARKAVKKTGEAGKASTYGDPTKADWEAVKDGSAWANKGGSDRLGKMGSMMNGNLQQAAMEEGRTVLGMAGSHAIRGAAWGAVAGGTIESAQGGSFWDGAKQGAFNGAALWTGHRMGMKATGASSMNPFKGGNQGSFSAGNNMWRATSKDADISGQAVAILNNRQLAGTAQSVMNQRKSAATRGQ